MTRRDAIRVFGVGLLSVSRLVCGGDSDASAASGLMLSPEQTQGPFYVSGAPVRADVTEGRPGVPLRLKIRVRDARTCRPIDRATVEIWHTDAAGRYSGVGGATTTFMR